MALNRMQIKLNIRDRASIIKCSFGCEKSVQISIFKPHVLLALTVVGNTQ